MADLFVSHSSVDADLARQIIAALEANGVSCWAAPRDVRVGEDYQSEILRGLRESAGVLLLFSRDAATSKHVAREVGLADEANKPIYLVRLTNVPISGPFQYTLANRQYVDFFGDPDAAIARIIQELPERRQMRVRTRTWVIPEDRRKKIGEGVVRAVLIATALSVISGGGFYFFERQASLTRCDALAGSELELDSDAPGLPLGMIDPAAAIPACRAAVRWNADSPRANYQLARSLASNGYTRAAEVYERARELRHPGAVLDNLYVETAAELVNPPWPVRQGVLEVVVALAERAAGGEPRAQALLADAFSGIQNADDATLAAAAELALNFGAIDELRACPGDQYDCRMPRVLWSPENRGAFNDRQDMRDLLTLADQQGRSEHNLAYDLRAADQALLSGAARRLDRSAAANGISVAMVREDAVAAGYAPSSFEALLETHGNFSQIEDRDRRRASVSALLEGLNELSGTGYRPAMARLAMFYLGAYPNAGVPRDYERAQNLLLRAAPNVQGEE